VAEMCSRCTSDTKKPLPRCRRCHRCHRRPSSFALQDGRAARPVTVAVKVAGAKGHDKGFLIAYAIVCDLTHDVRKVANARREYGFLDPSRRPFLNLISRVELSNLSEAEETCDVTCMVRPRPNLSLAYSESAGCCVAE
jgi:hypothetical protein